MNHVRAIMHQAGGPRAYPNGSRVVEGITSAGEKGESTPRYNLRLRTGRNV
jgi:hypothetical protein